jgi:hypothetical protein
MRQARLASTERDWLWERYEDVGALARRFAHQHGRPELAEAIESRALDALLDRQFDPRRGASPGTFIFAVVNNCGYTELRRQGSRARGASKMTVAEVGVDVEAQVAARLSVERTVARRLDEATPRALRKAVRAARVGNVYLALALIGLPLELCALLLVMTDLSLATALWSGSGTAQSVLAGPLGWMAW